MTRRRSYDPVTLGVHWSRLIARVDFRIQPGQIEQLATALGAIAHQLGPERVEHRL